MTRTIAAKGACVILGVGNRVEVDLSRVEGKWRGEVEKLLFKRKYAPVGLGDDRFVYFAETPAKVAREAYHVARLIRKLGVPAIARTF